MAYDGYYANQYQPGNMDPNPNEHGYPQAQYPYYEPDRLSMPQPQMPTGLPTNPTPEPYSYPEPQRFPQPYQPSSGHINEAVNSAVNSSGSNGYLSPEVLSQITATVIQQLKTTGLDNNLQGSGAPPPRSQSQQPPWQTDSRPHAESPPIVPPRSNSIPPPSSLPANVDNFQPYVSDCETRPSPRPTPPPADRRASVSSQGSTRSHMARPRPPDRDVTVMEMTTLEKIWGSLFEEDKRTPTKKFDQFLRGIAVHLIEDYEPKNSIVIVPEKLQKFYLDTHDPDDPYPWQDIFDDRTSSISRLFRETRVEHHLVQKNGDLSERPDVPGLTPKGFQQWATLMILSNPNREYERLAKAVLNMPVSNPDDKKERYPKDIPRRLFPDVPDFDLRERVEDHIIKHCGVDLPYITAEERSQAAQPQTRRSPTIKSPSTQRAHSYERGRPPRTSPKSAAAEVTPAVIDDEDIPIAPGPIERERKPYSAAPGRGKTYDEQGSSSASGSFSTSRPSASASAASIPEATSKPQRSEYDRDSLYARDKYSRGSRSSSRSVHRDGYRHSESDLPRDREPRYAGLSSQDLPYVESPVSADDEVRRFHHRGGSRGADEDYYRSGAIGGHGSSYGYDKHYMNDRFSRG
ncbi:unnamed protein product [Penicillium salamii]|uniref:DUF7514 domain-containing protein n=1 Tax=Penicillium salamii TaxID=1612424 RepID=A0A9W4JUS1_9EURO|nr:unnamed protein product [Penicillium salamii]CAG8355706.1 unnamed protein product [Penicillium salamii]CAG8420646.1 unnamed protein product [Penicillium salamii]